MMQPVSQRCFAQISIAVVCIGLASAASAAAARVDGSVSWMSSNSQTSTVRSAQDRVNDALQLVQQMKESPGLAAALRHAKGVFIVPHYGKGAFIVGGQAGGGVVLVKHASGWTSPAFYSLGGGSIGAQAGAEGGGIAMILVTDKAVNRFESSRGGWSLNGNAGLTIVNWSGESQANTTRGDIILWASARGLYFGLSASVTRFAPDTKMDHAYYQRRVTSSEILAGNVSNPDADSLRNALASRVASQ